MASSTPSDPSTAPAAAFSLFSELPPELRVLIWQLCLPHRVRELNAMVAEYEWIDWSIPGRRLFEPEPCSLTSTTKANNRPPVIAQVCREARKVAFTAAGLRSAAQSDLPGALRWDSQTPWTDYKRDMPHIHEAPRDTYKLASLMTHRWASTEGRSVHWLHVQKDQWEGDCAQYEDDLPEDFDYSPPRQDLPDPEHHPLVHEDCLVLQQRTDWRLVIQSIIIHATAADAVASGLFGLLGDAPIQIVDVFDTTTFDKYYEMAERGEYLININHYDSQHLGRQPPEWWQSRIREWMWCNKYPDALLSHVRPAVIFRLCTRLCKQRPPPLSVAKYIYPGDQEPTTDLYVPEETELWSPC